MTNRIPESLPLPRRIHQPSPPRFHEWRNLAQKQWAIRVRQVKTFVQEHPVAGIGTAFGIGVVLGWIVKRR